jgi:hypothetical protein
MPIYPGNPGVSVELAQSIDRGDEANVSRLELGAHTGTHVDAPFHFIPEGAGAEELPERVADVAAHRARDLDRKEREPKEQADHEGGHRAEPPSPPVHRGGGLRRGAHTETAASITRRSQ